MKKKIFLFLIFLVALAVRVYGSNWDQGFHLHPDERMIVMVSERLRLPQSWASFFSPQSPLNPRFFAYGSFPLYFLKFVSWLMARGGGSQWASYQYLPSVGRMISLVFDLGTALLIFKIGREVFGERVGFLGLFFYSTCVFPLQLAHFYAVDGILNFFIWLTLWFLLLFYRQPKTKNAFLVGSSFGLALATKISALVVLGAIGISLLVEFFLLAIKIWRQQKTSWWHRLVFLLSKGIKKKNLLLLGKRLFLWGGIIMVVTLLFFLLAEPYALIDFPTFVHQLSEQQRMTRNAFVFPYTLQYVGTVPYWYFLKNMVCWGMGIGLGGGALIGAVFYFFDLGRRIKKKGDYDQEAKELILATFFLAYFLVVGRFAVKFMRYFLPLYPFLIILAAKFLLEWGKKTLLVSVILLHLLWLFAFLSIYSRPNPRVRASQWINENLPLGSVLAVEHWDDRLPLWGGEKYRWVEMPMYERDQSAAKWKEVKKNLKEADYIILASNRLYVPLSKLADCDKYKICYPWTSQYYRDLFSGRLGFKKVAEFVSYPSLKIGRWRLRINDTAADESFTVYDHPRVVIFQNLRG